MDGAFKQTFQHQLIVPTSLENFPESMNKKREEINPGKEGEDREERITSHVPLKRSSLSEPAPGETPCPNTNLPPAHIYPQLPCDLLIVALSPE